MKTGEPGWFVPPFREGWTYEGITYGGHTDFSVDFNRRDPETHRWMQDIGNPVYPAWDGKVAAVDVSEGLVLINHYDGEFRTEYRHMSDITVKKGDKVTIKDRIGRINMVGSNQRITSPHLHHVHYVLVYKEYQRTKMKFYGVQIRTSVGNSDSRPQSWNPPAPVYLVGPERNPVESRPLYLETYNETIDATLTAINLVMLNPNKEQPTEAEIAGHDAAMATIKKVVAELYLPD